MSICSPLSGALSAPGRLPRSPVPTMTQSRTRSVASRSREVFGVSQVTRVTVVTRTPSGCALAWTHGQPHPHLHPHRRRRTHPARRHERDHQDRHAPARVRRRRRGQRPPRAWPSPRAASRTTWWRCSPTCRTTSSTSAPTSAPRSCRTPSSRRCGSSRTTSTGSRAGATTTTSELPNLRSFILNGGTAGRPTCTSRARSSVARSGPRGRRGPSTSDSMNMPGDHLPQPALRPGLHPRPAREPGAGRRALGARRRALDRPAPVDM